MKITEMFNGLKRVANGDYVLEGNLVSDEVIEIDLDNRLTVNGYVKTKKSIIVRWSIEAGDGIEAGGDIKAGDGIKAGGSIEAGWGIEARTFIDVEKRIFAGTSVYHSAKDCKKFVKCAELRRGEIAFGDLVIADAS